MSVVCCECVRFGRVLDESRILTSGAALVCVSVLVVCGVDEVVEGRRTELWRRRVLGVRV